MRLIVLQSSFLLLLGLASSASPATRYLSPDGDDTAPGSRDRPWATLEHANAALGPGDTLVVLAGEYTGAISPARSGEDAAPITYRAQTPEAAVLKGGPSGDRPLCVDLQDRQHIVVEGFLMLPQRGGWMRLTRANHCIIRNCRMENSTHSYSPIECRDCHYNRYESLRCLRANNIGDYGHVSGDMWNNYACSHCVFEDIHISQGGHRPFGLWFDCPYNIVRRCIFDCRWGRNFEFFSTPRLLVEQCVITNGFDGSGSADGRAKLFIVDSIFRRNVIHRNHYGPLVINAYKYGDLPTFGMLRSRVYHNTWYRNHEYGFEMVDNGREPYPHMVAGNVLQNNVFSHNDPGGDGLALLLVSNIAQDNRFVHNDLYGDRPGCRTVRYDWAWPGVESWGGRHMTALEANARMPGQFSGNIDADPRFADPLADDYRLQPGSPCIDAGAPPAVAISSGRGTQLPVDDARWFFDGFGIPGEVGDLIFIGAGKVEARVTGVDIDRGLLTLDREVSWRQGDAVSLPYLGTAPDLGAYEAGAENEAWYGAPVIPDGLRLVTMETAEAPVVVTDFEAENLEDWHYYWNFSRQRNTDARMDDTTAAFGKRSMRIFATADEAALSCDIRPRWWDIDRFPIVKLSYRIPPGVPAGLWLHAFKSAAVGQGAVCVGGTATRSVGGYRDLELYALVDDDHWHELSIDARVIREVFPEVKLLQMFRFAARDQGRQGQQFWFDNFRIEPQAQ